MARTKQTARKQVAAVKKTTAKTTEVALTADSIKKMGMADLVKHIEALGMKKSDVKRADGKKGNPLVSDFRSALLFLSSGTGPEDDSESSSDEEVEKADSDEDDWSIRHPEEEDDTGDEIIEGTSPEKEFTAKDIDGMTRPAVLEQLEILGHKESKIKRADGKPGKPTIADLRSALKNSLGLSDKKAPVKAPAKKAPVAKAPAKKAPAKKAPAKVERAGFVLNVDDHKTLMRHILDCEKSAQIALDQAALARSILKKLMVSEIAEDEIDEPTPAASPEKPKKKKVEKPEKASPEGEPLKVPFDPAKGYGVDKHMFVYDNGGIVIGKLDNDVVKVLVKADITKLEKLRIKSEKLTAKDMRARIVPFKVVEEQSDKKKKFPNGPRKPKVVEEISDEESDEDSGEEEGSDDMVDSDEEDENEKEEENEQHEEEGGLFGEDDEDSDSESDEDSLDDIAPSDEDDVEEEVEEKKPKKASAKKTPVPEIVEEDTEEEEDSDTEEEFRDSPAEGAEIAEHFEDAPEVSEDMFRKFVSAQHTGEIKLSEGAKVIAKKLGLTEPIVGTMIVKYAEFSKRWPNVVADAKDDAKKQTKKASPKKGAQPSGRRLLKKR